LFQKNVGIEIVNKNDGSSVFSFIEKLKKRELRENFKKLKQDFYVDSFVIDGFTFELYIYYINDNDVKISRISWEDFHLTKGLVNLVNGDYSDLSKHLQQGLLKAFTKNNTITEIKPQLQTFKFELNEQLVSAEHSLQCKDSIREILDESFNSFLHNPLVYSESFKMPTFFTVIRFPYKRGNYKYSAQILFSKNQVKCIEAKQSSKYSIADLEDPLDGNSISLSDRCFSLDTVQFGLPYNSNIHKSETDSDTKRRINENNFYNELLNKQNPDKVFFVPIHVNGTAWLAMYRIIPKNLVYSKMSQWSITYEMYNQYTLLIAEKVRLKAKEKYFKLLLSFIETAGNKSKETVHFLNESKNLMDVLSAYYPYPVPKFNRSGIELSVDEYLLHMDESKFNLQVNDLWNSPVDHDRLELDELNEQVIRFCKQVGKAIRNQKIEEELRDASYSISHLLKNKLDEPIDEVNEIVKNLNNLIENKGLKLDKSEYQRNYKEFEILSNDLRDTLSILDLIPKSTFAINEIHDYRAFLNNKRKYLLAENEALDLAPVIQDAANRKRVKIISHLSKCLIEPFIIDADKKKFSPKELVYHNCFVEAIINYKEIPHVGDLVITQCSDSDGTMGICFKNITNSEDQTHNEFIEVSRQYGFHGAIGYLNTVFKKVGVGIIKKRVIIQADIKYFELGMFLKNLKIEVNE